MAAQSRVSVKVYMDPKLRSAVRRKAARTHTSASAVMNEALERALREDAELKKLVIEARRQRFRPYEEFEEELRRDGLL
jgi:predicted transcriptional regulator